MKNTIYGIGGFDPTKANNNIVEEQTIPDPPQAPLDPVGALATLLAVTGTLTVDDAANAVGLTAADLVAEAQAWAVAEKP
tara:strand:- start:1084 stop:1323 length:240 start_codon:yes stop_codon:yes gene_type:complete